MKRFGSSHLLHGVTFLLAAGIVSAACGSDSEKRSVRDRGGGAGGEAGDAIAAAGEGNPAPQGGQAGEPSAQAGVGGESPGGAPNVGGEGGAGGSLPAVDCDTIVFADANLEAAVRDAISKPSPEPILPADVAGLTDLYAGGYGVALLDGIECLPSLTSVNLGAGGAPSEVVDLSLLAYLHNLTSFDCGFCPLTTVAPLGSLPNLTTLKLNQTGNGDDALDLSDLAAAPALVAINLVGTKVGSLSPLGEVASLEELQLDYALLADPASLGDVKSLKRLYAISAVTDATPLSKLTELMTLQVGSSTMTNTDALATLVKLTELNISYADVTDASFVQNMTQLSTLDLASNPLATLDALAANTGLATGDEINLFAVTTLNCTNEAANIATIKGRGATISGNPCP